MYLFIRVYNLMMCFRINFIFFLGDTYMTLGERSRGGGQNSISTILLIVSFMWVEFKYVFSAMFWPTADPPSPSSLTASWTQLHPVLCSLLFRDQLIAMGWCVCVILYTIDYIEQR